MLFIQKIFITVMKLLLQVVIIDIGTRHRGRRALCLDCFGGMRGRGPVGGPNGAKRDWCCTTTDVVTDETGVRSRARASTPSTLS